MYKFSHSRIYYNFCVIINFRVFPCGIGGRGHGEFNIIKVITAALCRKVDGALLIIRTPADCFCKGCTRASMGTRARKPNHQDGGEIIKSDVKVFASPGERALPQSNPLPSAGVHSR